MSEIHMGKEHLRALRAELTSQASRIKLDLRNLGERSVGIGEHVHLSEDYAILINKLDEIYSQTETIDRVTRELGWT